jgi:hypothetical protein
VSALAALFTASPPAPLLWAALAGWAVVAAGLWRGLRGRARKASISAHTLTLGGIVLRSTVLGYGLLETVIVAAAGWWALAAVTGLRPERLVDPDGGGLTRLGMWAAMTAALGLGIHHSLF